MKKEIINWKKRLYILVGFNPYDGHLQIIKKAIKKKWANCYSRYG